MKIRPEYSIISILVLAMCAGILLAPALSISRYLGGAFGALLGTAIAMIVPGLRRSVAATWNEEKEKADVEGRSVTLRGYLLHPTQLPILLGVAWFVVFVVAMSLFELRLTTAQMLLALATPAFGVGLSGFFTMVRREYVKRRMPGYEVVRGRRAILNGAVLMLAGWGMTAFMVLAIVFHW